MSKEPLTLAKLRGEKDTLDYEAHLIRWALHELVADRPDGWHAKFEQAQAELLTITKSIGRLDERIRALVESTIVTEEDDGVNRSLRAANPTRQMKTLTQLPPSSRPARGAEAASVNGEQANDDVYLSCFHTICKDSLDPRQFAALEAGARALVQDYQRMNEKGRL